MRTEPHRLDDGTVAVEVHEHGHVAILATELPGLDESDADCDTALIVTRDPAVLLALAASLVRAAAAITPRNVGGPGTGLRRAEFIVLAGYGIELDALQCAVGAQDVSSRDPPGVPCLRRWRPILVAQPMSTETMSKNKKSALGLVRPPVRRDSVYPRPHDPHKFKIDLDEGSAVDVRLDPDGTLVLTASDGRGRVATAWTTYPETIARLATRLSSLVLDAVELRRAAGYADLVADCGSNQAEACR